MVCVEYSDLLEITLPYNRHHFDSVAIVTTTADTATHKIADQNDANVFTTNSFYDNGAKFNKWIALEEGLDWFGRDGWLCIMDSDVMWPKNTNGFCPGFGNLYTPMRRMYTDFSQPIPAENEWSNLPYHRYQLEWSGYTQVFHCDDESTGLPPWHEINWSHCGGADSFFQAQWSKEKKLRPPFEVLHLGDGAENWCGRVSPFVDGSTHDMAGERATQLRDIFRNREWNRGGAFRDEKID